MVAVCCATGGNRAISSHNEHRGIEPPSLCAREERSSFERKRSLLPLAKLAGVKRPGRYRRAGDSVGLQATTNLNGGARPDSLIIGLAPENSLTND